MNEESLKKVLIVLRDMKTLMRDAANTSAIELLDEAIELIQEYIETGRYNADMKHRVLSALGKVLENLPSIVALIQLLSR
jgi:acetylglutamate kinase